VTRPRILAALALAVGAVLVGAALFGLWHVVVAGLIRGNARAGQFGVALTVVAGLLLALLVVVAARLRRETVNR
jgi:uncharacterized membrane protein